MTGPSKLPDYATYTVGVGGFVYDPATNKVLVVKEKTGPIKNIWKLPGGSVEAGEELSTAVVREVLEETGVKCEFVSLLCLRQSPGVFGRNNLYAVALLKPETTVIKIQEDEIEQAKWMDVCHVTSRYD